MVLCLAHILTSGVVSYRAFQCLLLSPLLFNGDQPSCSGLRSALRGAGVLYALAFCTLALPGDALLAFARGAPSALHQVVTSMPCLFSRIGPLNSNCPLLGVSLSPTAHRQLSSVLARLPQLVLYSRSSILPYFARWKYAAGHDLPALISVMLCTRSKTCTKSHQINPCQHSTMFLMGNRIPTTSVRYTTT